MFRGRNLQKIMKMIKMIKTKIKMIKIKQMIIQMMMMIMMVDPPDNEEQIREQSISGEAVNVERVIVPYKAPIQFLEAEPILADPIRMVIGGEEGEDEQDLTNFMNIWSLGS